MRAVIGIEDVGDDAGHRHPWRMVVIANGGRHVFHAAVPSVPRYLSNPRHPVHGDLTRLPASLAEALDAMMERLADDGVEDVDMAATHQGGPVARAIGWNGITVRYHDVDYDEPLRDPHSAGGYAGHEIAAIAQTIGEHA